MEVVTQIRPSGLVTRATYQRTAQGIVVTLTGLGALVALMLPFRAHLSIAIPALAFVLPAVTGVVIGGFLPGVVGAVGGFLVYDWLFLPPYDTFTVRSPSNWIALAVYAVVVLIVARVVDKLQDAREEALRRTAESERLFELSQALIGDLTLAQLLTHIAGTVQTVFSPLWTALVLPVGVRPQDPPRHCVSPPRPAKLCRTRTWPRSPPEAARPNPSGWKTTSFPAGYRSRWS